MIKKIHVTQERVFRAVPVTHPNVGDFVILADTDEQIQSAWALINHGEGQPLDATKFANVKIRLSND